MPILHNLQLPTWEDRASGAAECAYPELWNCLDFGFVPHLMTSSSNSFVDCVNGLVLPSSTTRMVQSDYGLVYNHTADGTGAQTSTQQRLGATGHITCVALIRTTTVASKYRTIFGQSFSNNAADFDFAINSTGGRFSYYHASAVLTGTEVGAIVLNEWAVVGCQRLGTTGAWSIVFWKDGRVSSTSSYTYNPALTAAAPYTVGSFNNHLPGFNFLGDLGPIWLWKRQLGDEEMRLLAEDPFAPLRRAYSPAVSLGFEGNRRRRLLLAAGAT